VGTIHKTPFLARRCSSPGCERMAHFTIKNAALQPVRVICDKCALLLKVGGMVVEAFKAEQERQLPDFNTAVEDEDRGPGDDAEPNT
jgi:hypothetical protein